MKNLGWKLLLIAVLVGLALWATIPPQEKIRLGKDLRGGVSLIYSVTMDEDIEDRQAVLAQTISVLKDRVDPSGQFDISMTPLGQNRIEISMPLPNERVVELKQKYESALEQLLEDAYISPAQLDESLRFGNAVETLCGEADSQRCVKIKALVQAYDELQAATAAMEAAGEEGDARRRAELAVARAELSFEAMRSEVLGMSLDRAKIVRAMSLSTEPGDVVVDEQGNPVIDEETGRAKHAPSQRSVILKELTLEYPHLAARIDAVVADYDTFQSERMGFDDPEDLIRLLRGAGVLEFHIAVSVNSPQGVNINDMRQQLAERGPTNIDSRISDWFAINELKQWYNTPQQLAALRADPQAFFSAQGFVAAEYEEQIYMLLYTSPEKSMTHGGDISWSIIRAGRTVDQLGRDAVSFTLDQAGGVKMAQLTGPHVNQPMAIVLDGQVYSAPNLNSQISSSGIIQGQFSPAEITYLVKVLEAGALEARLSPAPIAINTLGPTLGLDNLNRGIDAFTIALIIVAVFMMLYYFFAGIVANIGLLVNGILLFGFMAAIDATFTLPGLAGIVLTIGMAVDANVLIYERIREELFHDVDLRNAIRLGYSKALSTILDGNITNLVVCAALYMTATTEVKGFAQSLSIGIATTLFTALFVTRALFAIYTEVFKAKSMPMLATVFPGIHRALQPNIRWVSFRGVSYAISIVLVVVSLIAIYMRGADLFDTELRGGISVTMNTAVDPQTGERIMLKQADVESAIAQIGEVPEPESVSDPALKQRYSVLSEMKQAAVLTIGDVQVIDDAIAASSFQLKIPNPAGFTEEQEAEAVTIVTEAIVETLGEKLDVIPPLEFEGVGAEQHSVYTYAIESDNLGANINEPALQTRIAEFLGGVAIKLEDVTPPATPQEIAARIDRMRQQPDFADTVGRSMKVVGIDPADPNDPQQGYTSAVVLVHDADLSALRVPFEIWDESLAQREWVLTRAALHQPTSFEQVTTFSSAVADTLRAKANVAVGLSLVGILVYIWLRFGSLRYSVAATVALVHDVVVAAGALAVSAALASTSIGAALGIEDFRIDLGVVAALLTIIGYSLNDTIVIMDRIRENRGKRPHASAEIVNRAINQTMSRTILMAFTTLVSVTTLYIVGGSGIRAFSFCLLVGLIAGTYSTIAVAAPLVYKASGPGSPKETETDQIVRREEPAPAAV